MDLTHRFTVPAPIDVAWAAFNDLERIAPCFPGAALTSFDGEKFEGLVKVKLGPISLQYTGTGRFVERDETARRAVIEAKGKDKRGNGTAAAGITAQLTSRGDSETEVEVVTDLNVTGRPAQFGRGVMQDVSDKLLAQFAACVESKLGGDEPATVVAGPVEESPVAPVSAATLAAADDPAGDNDRTPIADQAERAVKSAPPSTDDAPPPSTGSRPSATGAPPADASAPTAELDLGATVLPVLLKRYAGQIVAAVAVLWVLRRIVRAFPGRR